MSVQDYGEPWTTAYGTIDDRHDDTVARDAMAGEAARIVTCINACAGLDIEAAIAAAREALESVTRRTKGCWCDECQAEMIAQASAALALLTPQRKDAT